MRNRGLRLLLVMAVLLAAALVLAQFVGTGQRTGTESSEALLDAMLDRIGVTQWAEAVDWIALQEAGGEMPVWVARQGMTYFHSAPFCGSMKSPAKKTLTDAIQQGFSPCPECWQASP